MTKKEERKEIKRQRKLLVSQYNEMVLEQERHRKEPKIVPEGVYISLRNINKVYDNYVQAVFDFNLDIYEHEFVVFVGPSGCGKSTTIRMIAGLEDITTGDLFIDGVYCNEKTAKERDVAMVFQNYALYPHMTVYENLAFGLQSRKYGKEEIDQRVRRAADILQITPYLDRRPKQLSGGQMQRVALGRAIVREAKVFLMDEPLSNLDAKLRVSMRSEIIKLHKQINATTIYVTHDQTEAMTMATKIVILDKGMIKQIGTPEEVYNYPSNMFVATFIGAPAMNLIQCKYCGDYLLFKNGFKITLTQQQQDRHDEFYRGQIQRVQKLIDDKEYEKPDLNVLFTLQKEPRTLKNLFKRKELPKIKQPADKLAEFEADITLYKYNLNNEHDVTFGIRPEDIYPSSDAVLIKQISEQFAANITLSELLGGEYQMQIDWGNGVLVVVCKANTRYTAESAENFVFNLDKIHIFDPYNEASIF